MRLPYVFSRDANMTGMQTGVDCVAKKVEGPTMRFLRPRSNGLVSSHGLPPDLDSRFNQDETSDPRVGLKRAGLKDTKPKIGALRVSSGRNKRRAVLKDVTNLLRKHALAHIDQNQTCKPRAPLKKNVKDIPLPTPNTSLLAVEESHEKILSNGPYTATIKKNRVADKKLGGSIDSAFPYFAKCCISKSAASRKSSSDEGFFLLQAGNSEICDDLDASNEFAMIDIDSMQKDPQWCSTYAVEMYNRLRALELVCRPSYSYMETIQRDITHGMRAILVDWLVEVSEEYKLVPDTLYLTVNLIDRYLSLSFIERNRLQLLGVTCMLIASKYEEICAPNVQELCFVTDNTYSKQQVFEMERQVLNLLGFRLSVPTTKTFLRRFIRAAQSCDEDHTEELELLANYLAELSLMEYSFVNFLPSLIAASSVFLARWTIDQSDHPWNQALEFHTNYKALQLKATVIEMQCLQLNINACPLNAIREKYSLQKFKRVATLLSAKSVQSLFQ